MMDTRSIAAVGQASKSVSICGLGNIGSHLAEHVGRMGNVGRVVLTDHDRYEAKNLYSQAVYRGDMGKPKVRVQADRMREINPSLDIEEHVSRLENVPLGRLGADLMVSALDSRSARRHLCQAAWRLGVPLIDGAVDASGLLVRVTVYVPGPKSPCPECSWDDAEYAAQEQEYPCRKGVPEPAATNAPSSLGAVVSGVMALECEKLLTGDIEHAAVGHEIMVDLRHHTHYLTRLPLNPDCRFDHQVWAIQRLPGQLEQITLARLFELLEEQCETGLAVGMEGQRFASRRFCPHCGKLSMRPITLLRGVQQRECCPACGEGTVIRGMEKSEWLELSKLTSRDGNRSLASVGFQPGDVLTVRCRPQPRHFELAGLRAARSRASSAASNVTTGDQT